MLYSDLEPGVIYFLIACVISVFVLLVEVQIKKLTLLTKKLNMTKKLKAFQIVCSLLLLFLLTISNQQLMDKLIAKELILSKKSLFHHVYY